MHLYLSQDKQSKTWSRGKATKAIPCAVGIIVLKDAAAASLCACSASSIPANGEMLRYQFECEEHGGVPKRWKLLDR